MPEISKQPYPGLDPYSEKDAKRFFGRKTDIEDFVARLKTSQLTILYGDSGVGKTSVARAGIVAKLREKAQENLRHYKVPVHAVVVFPSSDDFSWKYEPLPQLKEQIKQDIKKLAPNIQSPDPKLSFIKTLEAWTELLGGEEGDGELFIILDQFEEYFLYPHSNKEGKFALEFPRAVTRSRLRVNFLISMRKDSLAELDYFQNRLQNLLMNRTELKHLDWESGRKAIIQPIYDYYNHQVPPEEAFEIEIDNERREKFINQVLKGVSQKNNNNSSERIEAPYLQLVMERLWKEEKEQGSHCLRLETLTKLKGTEGIAELHLNERMERLSENKRDIEIAGSVFHYLVTPSGGKQAYSVRDLAALANRDQHDRNQTAVVTEDELNPWLDKLTQKDFRILRPVGTSPNLSYEIFHDVLAKPILDWLAEYWKQKQEERAEQEAKVITQKAKKIASRWGLGGIVIALFVIRLGIWEVNQLLTIQYDILQLQPFISSKESIRANREKIIRSLLNTLEKLNRRQWYLTRIKPNFIKTNTSMLMRRLGSVFFIDNQDTRTFKDDEDEKSISAISFSPNGNQLATGSIEGKINLWNLQEQSRQKPIRFPSDGKAPISSMSFSPDRNRNQLVTGSEDGKISLWDLQEQSSLKPVRLSSSGKTAILSMSLSSGGNYLATGSKDGVINLWDLPEQSLLKSVTNDGKAEILSMSLSPDGNQLVTGSWDSTGTTLLWDIQKGLRVKKFISPTDENTNKNGKIAVLSMSFSPDEKQLITASDNGFISFWDIASNSNKQKIPPRSLIQPGNCLLTVTFNHDGSQLAVVSGIPNQNKDNCIQKRISLFNEQGRQRMYDYPIEEQDNPIKRITFSPDGKQLATASKNGTVEIWPVYTFDDLLNISCDWLRENSQDQDIKDLPLSCREKN